MTEEKKTEKDSFDLIKISTVGQNARLRATIRKKCAYFAHLNLWSENADSPHEHPN